MAEKVPQTRANHVRLDPSFHFVLLPVLLVLFVSLLIYTARHPGREAILVTVLAAMSVLAALKTRQYAAKVQDRVIRLEERLRLSALLPDKGPQLGLQLSEGQLVALRFASDAEFPILAERAVREKLNAKQIKDAIQEWRPDYYRV